MGLLAGVHEPCSQHEAIRHQGRHLPRAQLFRAESLTFGDLEIITHPWKDPRELQRGHTASDPDPPIRHPVLSLCKTCKLSGPGFGGSAGTGASSSGCSLRVSICK